MYQTATENALHRYPVHRFAGSFKTVR